MKNFVDMQVERLAEAKGLEVPEAVEEFKKTAHVIDFDNLPKQNHSWTDRGLKATCEGANHPYHEYWYRRSAIV